MRVRINNDLFEVIRVSIKNGNLHMKTADGISVNIKKEKLIGLDVEEVYETLLEDGCISLESVNCELSSEECFSAKYTKQQLKLAEDLFNKSLKNTTDSDCIEDWYTESSWSDKVHDIYFKSSCKLLKEYSFNLDKINKEIEDWNYQMVQAYALDDSDRFKYERDLKNLLSNLK